MKPTIAQLWLIHAVEALMVTSAGTIIATGFSAVSSGNFNFTSTLIALAGTLGVVVSTGLKAILINHQTQQAATDTLTEVKNGLNSLLASHHLLSQIVHAFLGQQIAAPDPLAAPAPIQPPLSAAQPPLQSASSQSVSMPDWMQGLSPVPSQGQAAGGPPVQTFPVLQPQSLSQAQALYGQVPQAPFPPQPSQSGPQYPAAPGPGSTADYTLSGPWTTVPKPQ